MYLSFMSDSSFFKNKSERWWHIWSCSRCNKGDALDKSDETRAKILMAAFDEIYQRGFQAASLSNILKNTNITKGALYHHFNNKMELGYAVVDEVIHTTLSANWIEPLLDTDDPIPVIQQILQQSGDQMTEEDVRLGCPLNNLAQEMSPIDEGFRERIKAVYTEWQEAIEGACERGKLAGNIRQDADAKQHGVLFVATLQGCLGLAKSTQSLDVLMQCGHGLIEQLELLKPEKKEKE
jgi:AcrR family transcriptional regulator